MLFWDLTSYISICIDCCCKKKWIIIKHPTWREKWQATGDGILRGGGGDEDEYFLYKKPSSITWSYIQQGKLKNNEMKEFILFSCIMYFIFLVLSFPQSQRKRKDFILKVNILYSHATPRLYLTCSSFFPPYISFHEKYTRWL